MSDFFSLPVVQDIIRGILSRWPLQDVQTLQLVDKQWRQMIASPEYSYQILGKGAVLMVSPETFFVVHLKSLLDHGDGVVYTRRLFPVIKFPVLSLGTCNGLILVKDFYSGLYVLNPRNLKCRKVVGPSLLYKPYALGWRCDAHSCRFHIVLIIDLSSRKIRILNLLSNEWSYQKIEYENSDWKLDAISEDEGVFVSGVFAWLGRGIRIQDDHVFHCIIMYDVKREVFDFMELPESLNRPGMRNLADDIVGLWERGKKDCFWLCFFEKRVCEKVEVKGYSDSGEDFEPICFSVEQNKLLLLLDHRRLQLYDLTNHSVSQRFPDIPSARFSTKRNNIKALRFTDTFESPGEDFKQQ